MQVANYVGHQGPEARIPGYSRHRFGGSRFGRGRLSGAEVALRWCTPWWQSRSLRNNKDMFQGYGSPKSLKSVGNVLCQKF